MSSVQDVGAASARSLAQVYQQLAASRRNPADQTRNRSQPQGAAAEEAAESPAERATEARGGGNSRTLDTVA